MNMLNQLEVKCGITNCPKKDEVMTYETLYNRHVEECVPKHVDCPNNCGSKVSKYSQHQHLTTCAK